MPGNMSYLVLNLEAIGTHLYNDNENKVGSPYVHACQFVEDATSASHQGRAVDNIGNQTEAGVYLVGKLTVFCQYDLFSQVSGSLTQVKRHWDKPGNV